MTERVAVVAAILALIVSAGASADSYRWQGVERVVAVGDVHGAYDELISIMQGTGVIDGNLKWSGGTTHFVSVGDIPDRGARTRDVLELFMRLEGEAEAAGGRLHLVLGNHEVMNLTGDLRYVSDAEYAAFANHEPPGLREKLRAAWQKPEPDGAIEELNASEPPLASAATPQSFDETYPPGFFGHLAHYAPGGEFGHWLLERPLAIVVNDTLFVHGGLSPELEGKDLDEINADVSVVREYAAAWQRLLRGGVINPATPNAARADLVRAAMTTTTDELLAEAAKRYLALDETLVLSSDSTTWYRGTAYCHEYAEVGTTQAVLDRVGASRVAFGHTPTIDSEIVSRMNGRVLMLDTGMLRRFYKGQPSALVIENGVTKAWYADSGQHAAIQPAPRRAGPRPGRLTDDDIERILREGRVVNVEDIGIGISRPKRITLRDGDVEIRAAFVTINERAGGAIVVAGRTLKGPADRYQFNVAAYKLDRLLGLDMVPVTVERRIQGKLGSLQFWIENAMNHKQRLEKGIQDVGWCSLSDQYNLTHIWDVLIYNLDRSHENILYTKGDWMVWLIDHTRAFSSNSGRPPVLRNNTLIMSDDLVAALDRLDEATLQAELGELLNKSQIRVMLKRRDRLLKDWNKTKKLLKRARKAGETG